MHTFDTIGFVFRFAFFILVFSRFVFFVPVSFLFSPFLVYVLVFVNENYTGVYTDGAVFYVTNCGFESVSRCIQPSECCQFFRPTQPPTLRGTGNE